MRAIAPLLLLALASACALRHGPATETPRAAASYSGAYRGTVESREGGRERFRASVWVAEPDRLHLEISGPVGGPVWIVDAGNGRVAVTRVDRGIAYVGSAEASVFDRLLGIAADPASIVAAVLRGEPIAGVATAREPAGAAGLPERFEAEARGGKVRLDRTSLRQVPADSLSRLGTGEAPEGVPTRPLADLPADESPLTGERRSG